MAVTEMKLVRMTTSVTRKVAKMTTMMIIDEKIVVTETKMMSTMRMARKEIKITS